MSVEGQKRTMLLVTASATDRIVTVMTSWDLLNAGLSTSNDFDGDWRVKKRSCPKASTSDSDSRRPGAEATCVTPRSWGRTSQHLDQSECKDGMHTSYECDAVHWAWIGITASYSMSISSWSSLVGLSNVRRGSSTRRGIVTTWPIPLMTDEDSVSRSSPKEKRGNTQMAL